MPIDRRPDNSAQRSLIVAVIGLVAVSLLFRLLVTSELQHTSLVFIGIPAVLAIIVALTPPAKSFTGMIVKVMTLALLMSGILLGEGFICILMAAPLFYVVGIAIGLVADLRRKRRAQAEGLSFKSIVFLSVVLAPAGLEGVVQRFAFDRDSTIVVSRVVPGSAEAIRDALALPPSFDRDPPAFFKLGFPVPGETGGAGIAVGDRRSVELRHGRHPGTLVLEVRKSEPGHVEFVPVSDESYILHWLTWRRSEVRWLEVAPGETLVTWTLEYRRRLDPAWYFGPLERYGVRLAAGYLIDTLATPRTAGSQPSAPRPAPVDVFCRSWFAR
jgi:hypothetical protein